MEPKISVILPFYNAANTLSRALDSITSQTYENFECILINNNADDKCSKLAKKFCKKDGRFKLLYEERQGVVFASNKGSANAKGDFICRMDADDELTTDSLAKRVDYLVSHPGYDVVCGLAEYIPHHHNTAGFRRYVKWSNSIRSYHDILLNRFAESPVINPTAMWRKEAAENHGMYRYGDFPEDYELWLRWLDAGVKIHKLDEIVLRWYDSDQRLTRTDSCYSDKAFFKIKARYLARWLKHEKGIYEVWVWGASRRSRRWSKYLKDEGIKITAYIDIHKKRKIEGHHIVYFGDLPSPDNIFILVYNRHHLQKKEIASILKGKGFKEGKNFLFAG